MRFWKFASPRREGYLKRHNTYRIESHDTDTEGHWGLRLSLLSLRLLVFSVFEATEVTGLFQLWWQALAI